MVLTMTTDEMSQALKEIMKRSNKSNDDSPASLFCSIWTPRSLEDSHIYTFWPPATETTTFHSHEEVDGHLNDATMSLNGKTCNVGTHLHGTTESPPAPRLSYAGAALSSPATPTSFLNTKMLTGTQKFEPDNTNADGKIESIKKKTPTTHHLTPTTTPPENGTITGSYKTALFSTPKQTTRVVLSPLVRRQPAIFQSPLADYRRSSIPAYERSLLPPGILSSPVIDDEMYFPSDLLDMDDSYSTITVSYLDSSHTTNDGSFFVRPDSYDEGQVEIEIDGEVDVEATQIKGDNSSWGNIDLKSDEEDKENLQPCLDCGIWKSLNEFSGCTDDELNAGVCLACEWKPATKKTKTRRRQRDSKGSAAKSQHRRPLATLSADTEQNQKQLQLQKERYKTKLCLNFMKRNDCPYGPACIFAHGKKELRAEPQL